MTQLKSVDEAVQSSKAVFSGRVLEIKKVNGLDRVRFKVINSWKGVETQEVLVQTDRLAESPHYKVGESYLVFAAERDGLLFTGACSRTKLLAYAREDLKQLGKGTGPEKAKQ